MERLCQKVDGSNELDTNVASSNSALFSLAPPSCISHVTDRDFGELNIAVADAFKLNRLDVGESCDHHRLHALFPEEELARPLFLKLVP